MLERRLIIVTGKGGTGKTSVVAALALAAAARGLRVAATEVGLDESLPGLLDPGGPPVGYAGREVVPGVDALHLDPYAALAEYLGLQIGGRALVERVLRNKAFRQLMDAAPGWRELIALGKVWHLESLREPDGRPRFDLILVDAPATGHGLTFLDVPRVTVSAVRTGPLRRNAGLVEEMIRDRERSLLLPVALAEELPVRETAELVARVRTGVGIAVDRVVVNAVRHAPFPAGLPDLDERLARLPASARVRGLPRPGTLADCAAHLRARYELNRTHFAELGRLTGLPLLALPHLPEGVSGPEELRILADPLLAEPSEAA